MQPQKFLIPKDAVMDVALDYGKGYILHINNSNGVIILSKVTGQDKKEDILTYLLPNEEE